MDDSDERAWVVRAKHDAEAFGYLYRRHVNRIYNYHYRHTNNIAEAEDLTSRTFFKALQSIARYEDQGMAFQAWLFCIAHNLVVNWYRDESRHPRASLENAPVESRLQLLSAEVSPPEQVMAAEDLNRLRGVFQQLPEERKTLLILKFVEQMPNSDIAAVLGKTEGAIKALYHRTLLTLRYQMLKGDRYETMEMG